ncbi:SOQ1 [Symbiodinium pilosum]|uniref:SOQ1 protein n=1 Tax=Symbiodinium pilosum TaxID=2952 RepID=A0A812W1D0_SYMPI|nr:SOQ1 [Symbiodinium pilosum]
MHDGDKKEVTIASGSVTIKPSGNTQTWTVKADLDPKTCQALIDFNVPGKPNPPPVKLLMTYWSAIGDEASTAQEKATFEFTDPSGKLASSQTPLNSWLSLGTPKQVEQSVCPESLTAVYLDMHDGDKKAVDIQQGKMTIRPSGNNQTWVVKADVDDKCIAEVDFNVPGKPSPPPVPLQLKLWRLFSGVLVAQQRGKDVLRIYRSKRHNSASWYALERLAGARQQFSAAKDVVRAREQDPIWSIWIFWALCGAEEDRQLATRLAPNLALGQPVVLSSTAQWLLRFVSDDGTETWTGDGFRATDGDFGTAFFFGMGPLDIRLGNAIITWRENLVCAEAVQLDRLRQPNMFNCLASGRYLWLVLRVTGTMVAPLSVCEVEVTPKGPSGNRHILQTAGGMWPLQLQGVALAPHDRIRIVADTVLCGLAGSATMHDDVLRLTAPMGQRAHGDSSSETWENIQINRMGIYKVCWCGGDGDCTQDEHFSMHVATLVINGLGTNAGNTGASNGRASTTDGEGDPGVLTPLSDPYGIAISNQRAFFTERGSHMLRYLDIEQGRVYRLAGQFFPGTRGDYGSAINAQLSSPMGLALNRDQTSLFIADYGSDRVRRIELTRDPLNRGIIETIAGNGFRGFSGDGGPALEAQLNGPTGVAVDLNQMLWICDSGNNVLRVVSMEIPVRIPGTNEFQSNVILTAAGGSSGQAQGKGDGGVAWLARLQTPSGVAVSSAFVSNEDGTLPVNVYISESSGQQVRSMSLEFQSYLGVINTLAGSGQQGDNIKEAAPLEAPNAELSNPTGVATDAGVVYLSDSGNHRLLMMPALEYVSMGCWRENIESPWIPSIEGQPLPYGIDYLQGIPENRPAAITACALATMRLGYEVFAIRQMGLCATSKDAYGRHVGVQVSNFTGQRGHKKCQEHMAGGSGSLT